MARDDFGVFDGEAASARIDALIAFDHEQDPVDLAAHLGLALVLRPESFLEEPERWVDLLHAHPRLEDLDEEARLLVEQIALDPVAFVEPQAARSSKLDYVFGDRCHGPRYGELLEVPGVERRIQLVADRAAAYCDHAAAAGTLDALREAFVGLGLVYLLRGVVLERARIDHWERAFDKADRETRDDRAYWDVYRRRVWILFQLLKRRFID